MRFSVDPRFWLFVLFLGPLNGAIADAAPGGASPVATGNITGTVRDAELGIPIAAATVQIGATDRQTVTNANGVFLVADLPVGAYSIHVIHTGHTPQVQTDVIVKPGRTVCIVTELQPAAAFLDEVTVTPDYFAQPLEHPASVATFSHEELRRAAGSGGDITKYLNVLPSVAKINTMMNHLVVRGGSPVENISYIDNIEIPNINHYPIEGSSSGFSPLGLLNIDFIDEASFSSGGFSATYGDYLSSVLDIRYREGNRSGSQLQLDTSLAGVGIVGEGPLPGQNGSWLVSTRRSYLDLLFSSLDYDLVPRYTDLQGKLVLDLSDRDRLTLLAIVGDDSFEIGEEQSWGDFYYGAFATTEATVGLNWYRRWSDRAYSNTSLSTSHNRYDSRFLDEATEDLRLEAGNRETSVTLRSVSLYQHSPAHTWQLGFEVKRASHRSDFFVGEYIDYLGNQVPDTWLDRRVANTRLSLFGTHTWRPTPRLTLNVGTRVGRFSDSGGLRVSPRASLDFALSPRTSLSGSVGVYHQPIPLTLLARARERRDLDTPVAYHAVLGLDHRLAADTRLTVELYGKEYDHFPLDPVLPQFFIVDEVINGFMFLHDTLVATGKARSYGIEIMVQKKLAERFYGLASVALSRSRYRGLDGVWRDRTHDNRLLASLQAGYRFNNRWQCSVRWLYAGAPPYTPFDLAQSRQSGDWFGVLDSNRVNAERDQPYHELSLRLDRQIHWHSTSLTAYFSLWNVYNRRHLSLRYWDRDLQQPGEFEGSGIIPVVGLELEL